MYNHLVPSPIALSLDMTADNPGEKQAVPHRAWRDPTVGSIAFGSIMKEGGVTHNALVWNEYNQCGAGITFNAQKEAEPMPIPQRHSRQDPLVSLSEVKPPSSERSWGKYSCTKMG